MLLTLALTALALQPAQEAPAAAPAPRVVVARSQAVAPARPSSLAQRLAEARRKAAPPARSTYARLREEQRLAALYPTRPADGLGASARRLALGETPQAVRADQRLGSEARRAALSRPALPLQRPRRR